MLHMATVLSCHARVRTVPAPIDPGRRHPRRRGDPARTGPPYTRAVPSYRVELDIGDLRPGRTPQDVMRVALDACGEHQVDATDVAVFGGIPRILIRFSVPASSDDDEDAAARGTADRVRAGVETVAHSGRRRILRRRRGAWLPVG